jgi:hypothetical protein
MSQLAARSARYRIERDDARGERDASRVAYLQEQNRLLRHQLEGARSLSPMRRIET